MDRREEKCGGLSASGILISRVLIKTHRTLRGADLLEELLEVDPERLLVVASFVEAAAGLLEDELA